MVDALVGDPGRAAQHGQRHHQAQPGGLRGRATRSCGWRSSPAPGVLGRAGPPSWTGCGTWSWSRLTTPLDVYLAKFQEGAGIVEERITGARRSAAPASSCGIWLDGNCRLPVDARPAARGRERTEIPGLHVPGGPRVRPGDHPARRGDRSAVGARGRAGQVRGRLRRGSRPPAASGRRTPSSSTCARAGPRTRSSPSSSSPTACTTPLRRSS